MGWGSRGVATCARSEGSGSGEGSYAECEERAAFCNTYRSGSRVRQIRDSMQAHTRFGHALFRFAGGRSEVGGSESTAGSGAQFPKRFRTTNGSHEVTCCQKNSQKTMINFERNNDK